MKRKVIIVFLLLFALINITLVSSSKALSDFDYTTGFGYLDGLFNDPANVVVPIENWKMMNFKMYRDWIGVRAYSAVGNGYIEVDAPEGQFHLGLMLYALEGGAQELSVEINGEKVDTIKNTFKDNRYYLHFSEDTIKFAKGDKVIFRTLNTSSSRIAGIIFMPESPQVVHREYEIRNADSKFLSGFLYREDMVRLTWTTTWPATGEVEIKGGGLSISLPFDKEAQLHRLDWNDFQPGATYKWIIKAITPEGESIISGPYEFIAASPREPHGGASLIEMVLPVSNTTDKDLIAWPTKTGIPFAEGELGSADNLQVIGPDGEEILTQATVLSRWPDNSVKWLLLEFMVNIPAGQSIDFKLCYGNGVSKSTNDLSLVTETLDGIEINTGPLKLKIDPMNVKLPGEIWVNPDGFFTEDHKVMAGGEAILTMPGGEEYSSAGKAEVVRIESAGPVRATIYIQGHHRNNKGKVFMYEARLHAFKGSTSVWLEYTFGNDNPGKFSLVKSLKLELPLCKEVNAIEFGGSSGAHEISQLKGSALLSQIVDRRYEVISNGELVGTGVHAPGWVELSGQGDATTVVPRYFWQNYPKAIEVNPDHLSISLMPEIQRGQYDREAKNLVEETRLFFHLKEGGHKLKNGMSKRHDILFAFGDDIDHIPTEYVDNPLKATVPRKQYAQSGVFGPMSEEPGAWSNEYANTTYWQLKLYVDNLINNQRAYGMLHFGDWWGERKYNWGNLEYDLVQGMFLTYVHTGDELAFELGQIAALHQMNIDIIRQSSNTKEIGYQHEHCMGHVGDYWSKKPFKDGGIYHKAGNLGHVFNSGLVSYYHLTGDPMGLETAILMSDYYIRAKSSILGSFNNFNNWNFDFERFAGWPLLMFVSTYEGTGDPYYLNAAKLIMERAFENASAGGAWLSQVDRCAHPIPCIGAITFQSGVLLTGILEYYRVTNDERVPTLIMNAVKDIIEKNWDEELQALTANSCSEEKRIWDHCITPSLAAAYTFSEDPEILKILELTMKRRLSLQNIFQSGKALANSIRFEPYALKLMDELVGK